MSEVVRLGYADSGWPAPVPPRPGSLSAADPAEVAARVADVLLGSGADTVISYDAAGGYGHTDHRSVHAIGRELARQVPVRLLEATVPREAVTRALRLASLAGRVPHGADRGALRAAFTPRADISHVVDVRRWVPAKQQALAAHASQTEGGSAQRTVALLAGLPPWLARRVLGREWYVEVTPGPDTDLHGDLFVPARRRTL